MRTNEKRKMRRTKFQSILCMLLILLCSVGTLSGCRMEKHEIDKEEENENERTENEKDEASGDDAQSGRDDVDGDVVLGNELENRIIWSQRTVVYIEDNGELTKIYEIRDETPDVTKVIKDVVFGEEGDIFVLEEEYDNQGYLVSDNDWSMRNTIYCMDSLGNVQEPVTTICDEVSVNMIFFQGALYVTYGQNANNGQNQIHWCAYEKQADGTFVETETALCRNMQMFSEKGYSFCDNKNGLTLLQEMNLLVVWDEDYSSLLAFNSAGDIAWEINPDPVDWIVYIEDGYFYDWIDEGDRFTEVLFHLSPEGELERIETGDADVASIIAIKDETIYFAEFQENVSETFVRSVYAMQIGDPELQFLFEENIIPGQNYYGEQKYNVTMGFYPYEDRCYFISEEPGVAGWYSCSLDEGASADPELLLAERTFRGIYDMGDVSKDSITLDCPDCGEQICRYYFENFVISEDVIPNANVMNRVLEEDFQEEYTYGETEIANVLQEDLEYIHECGEYTGMQTGDYYFGGATEFTFLVDGESHSYLQVYEYGYEYWGGAHGYPLREYFVFSEETGELVDLCRLLEVDEETYRTVVAEYTLQDYRNRTERGDFRYYDYYGEESLYQAAYESASFVISSLAKEGVVAMYSPYDLGPFSAGYIEVLIPYEEFGITLTDIYGAAEYEYSY